MAKLLAICEHCGLIFPHNSVDFGRGAMITFENITLVDHCPKCGNEVGISPQGTYRAMESVVEFLGASDPSIEDLQKLARLVQQARDKKQNVTEFSEALNKELPEFSPISDFLRKHGTTIGLVIGFLSLLAGVIQTIITAKQYQESHQQKNNINPQVIINQTINNYYPSANDEDQKKAQPPRPMPKIKKPMPRNTTKKRVGVNQPCDCGSGKKRKKCHP